MGRVLGAPELKGVKGYIHFASPLQDTWLPEHLYLVSCQPAAAEKVC